MKLLTPKQLGLSYVIDVHYGTMMFMFHRLELHLSSVQLSYTAEVNILKEQLQIYTNNDISDH